MAVFTDAERVEVWDRRQAGELNRSIGRSLGRSGASIRALIESTGGVRPSARKRCTHHLPNKPLSQGSPKPAHNGTYGRTHCIEHVDVNRCGENEGSAASSAVLPALHQMDDGF